MAKEIRHTAKDNIFRNMFGRTEYTIQLYRALHPEDTITVEDDIKICTLETMQSRGIYNDLGFLAGDKLIILVEEQSSWSDNIAIRSLLYLAYSYLDYIEKTDINLYGSTKLQLPKPELYVVYTKERENHPDTISIRKNIFPDEKCCIDAEVKVLYKDNSKSIVDQYINYCFVYDEQTKLHGYTQEALKEIFRICIEEGYLKEYLNEHRTEVIKMMDILFDQERQDRLDRAALLSEGIGIGEARGELNMLAALVRNKLLSKDIAAAQLGISVEEFDKRYKESGITVC